MSKDWIDDKLACGTGTPNEACREMTPVEKSHQKAIEQVASLRAQLYQLKGRLQPALIAETPLPKGDAPTIVKDEPPCELLRMFGEIYDITDDCMDAVRSIQSRLQI